MKKSIVFYETWGTLIDNIPANEAGELIKMICDYSFKGNANPSGNELIDAMFLMIKLKLDEDAEAYDEAIKRRSEGGKKGMQKRWGKDNSHITKDNSLITNDNRVITPDKSVIKMITPITDTVTDTVTVTVTDTNNNREKRKRFSPPSLDEVKEYCRERNNNVDADRFVDFYSSKGWKIGNQPMKDWKAAVRTWERRDNNNTVPAKGHFENERSYDFDEIERTLLGGIK